MIAASKLLTFATMFVLTKSREYSPGEYYAMKATESSSDESDSMEDFFIFIKILSIRNNVVEYEEFERGDDEEYVSIHKGKFRLSKEMKNLYGVDDSVIFPCMNCDTHREGKVLSFLDQFKGNNTVKLYVKCSDCETVNLVGGEDIEHVKPDEVQSNSNDSDSRISEGSSSPVSVSSENDDDLRKKFTEGQIVKYKGDKGLLWHIGKILEFSANGEEAKCAPLELPGMNKTMESYTFNETAKFTATKLKRHKLLCENCSYRYSEDHSITKFYDYKDVHILDYGTRDHRMMDRGSKVKLKQFKVLCKKCRPKFCAQERRRLLTRLSYSL